MPDTAIPQTTPTGRGSRRRTVFTLVAAIIAVIAIATVLYSALSSPQSKGPTANGSPSAAPVLTASTMTGREVALSGARAAVVFFFSVECGNCGPGLHTLAQAQSQPGADHADFVAVDIAGNETDPEVRSFLTANNATALAYTIDTDTRWARRFNVNQLSTAVVLDPTGRQVLRAVDPSAEQLQAALGKAAA